MSEMLNSMNVHLETLSRRKEEIEMELADCNDEGRKTELNEELQRINRQMVGFIPSNGLRR